MNGFKRKIVNTPFLGRFLLILYRARTSLTYFHKPLSRLLIWLFKSKETTNFTYDLEETNKRYLASLIADITNERFDVILSFINEIDEDNELRAHIKMQR